MVAEASIKPAEKEQFGQRGFFLALLTETSGMRAQQMCSFGIKIRREREENEEKKKAQM